MVEGDNALVRKLSRNFTLSDEECAKISGLLNQNRSVERRIDLLSEGVAERQCYVVLEGWAICYKLMADGRRQIINTMLPGDFLGLRSVLLRVSDHTITSVSALRLSPFSENDLRDLMTENPRIAMAILWSLSRDEAIVVEHLVDLGRRNALERLAHFIIELHERLKLIGLAEDDGFACPLIQEDFADTLGLTGIHVNRIFRQLRERRLVTFTRGHIEIHDLEGLAEVADFSPTYLDHDNRLN